MEHIKIHSGENPNNCSQFKHVSATTGILGHTTGILGHITWRKVPFPSYSPPSFPLYSGLLADLINSLEHMKTECGEEFKYCNQCN